MAEYRTGNHHGVTICAENDGARCGREGHDCARGHLVAVVVNGDQALAERICALLNAELSMGPQPPPPSAIRRLNGPMVARLRECAADTSSNWDGRITIYPPEARELVALIDASGVQAGARRA